MLMIPRISITLFGELTAHNSPVEHITGWIHQRWLLLHLSCPYHYSAMRGLLVRATIVDYAGIRDQFSSLNRIVQHLGDTLLVNINT